MTPVGEGYWCLGVDGENNLYRPVPEEGSFVWPKTPNTLQEGYTYDFILSADQRRAQFPQEKVVSTYIPCQESITSDVISLLESLAKPSIEQIFESHTIDKRYITLPAVFGIWKFDNTPDVPKPVVYRNHHEQHKRRITIGGYDLPFLPKKDELPLGYDVWYVILGLSHPFEGTLPNHFNPWRCYIMVLGIRCI